MAQPRFMNKGITEITYASDDILQRFTAKDFTGEIRVRNADGSWGFDPPIAASELSGLEEIVQTIVDNTDAFPEAPIDGKQYARKNADWFEVAMPDVNTTIDNAITATVTVGGVSSGTTIPAGTEMEQVLRNILTPYQTSSLSTFTVQLTPTATLYEVGQQVSLGNAVFTYTNDSNGFAPKNFVVTGTGFTGTYQSSPIASDNSTQQYVSASTRTWTLAAQNANNVATNTLTFSRSAQWRVFFGALSSGSVTIGSLQQSKLNANQTTTWTSSTDNANGSNYTYLAYSASYPDLTSIVLNGAAPVLGAFTKQSDVSYTNSYGITQTYKVYKSNATGAFANGDTLTIS